MKTPEEIKKIKEGLKRCSSVECSGEHGDCPYLCIAYCQDTVLGEALSCIEQLEERIDLMMIQMRGDCRCCAYKGRPSYKSPCTECLCGKNRPMWEYEGFPDEKKETKNEQNERVQAD